MVPAECTIGAGMRARRLARLNRNDVEAIVRLHAGIAAAHTSLNQSSWSGRALVINVLEQCDILISDLFNRCERIVLGVKGEPGRPANSEVVSDLTASMESNGNLDPVPAGQERE
jgi:hypothetical protein